MKTFVIHLDALITILVLFTLLIGFSIYQYFQYSDLLKEHINLQASLLKLEYSHTVMDIELKNCKNNIRSQ